MVDSDKLALYKKVERLFSSRPHHGGAWLAGQPSVPAEPGAGAARLLEHRVEGRSLSDLRPDDQFRCTALAGFSDSRILCLQWVVGLGTGLAHALLFDAAVVRSRAAADLYAFGQWSAAWSHLARFSRSVGPLGLGLIGSLPVLAHV